MRLPSACDSRKGCAARQRMMAAMDNRTATCGYNCQDYSDAVALRKEEWINLCELGKETNRMLS